MEPRDAQPEDSGRRLDRAGRAALVVLAALTGLALMVDSLWRSSATYDEVMYMQVAARWWRTGEQQQITRVGSPLTFWKLQQAPTLWSLDRLGYGAWIDDPERYEASLLPWVRISSLWVWLAALGLVVYWSRRLYGPRAMVIAAWWFALSPNLLAHGPLATMETPVLASMTGMALLFWIFLKTGDRRAFLASAAVGGLAFSCKFTAVVAPPIFAVLWLMKRWEDGDRRAARMAISVAAGMAGYSAVMALSDVLITGGAMLPISVQAGDHPSFNGRLGAGAERVLGRLIETPIPQDWAGFVRQAILQKSGAPSYLFGEVRETGWRHYYLVTLAVKVPLAVWLVLAVRAALSRRIPSAGRDWVLPAAATAFLVVASLGSTRNFGVRYLLPVAPLAIVWISGLAEGGRWGRRLSWAGVAAMAIAIASIHPYELSYFNVLAGGPIGGRKILSDSNLDWAQGLKPLARLQRERPELRDLTLFYFGDSEAERYGIAGTCYTVRAANGNERVPRTLDPDTTYLAVSASLQWGALPASQLFQSLDGVKPVCFNADTTIAVYRTADIPGLQHRAARRAAERAGRVANVQRSDEKSRD